MSLTSSVHRHDNIIRCGVLSCVLVNNSTFDDSGLFVHKIKNTKENRKVSHFQP